MSRGAEIGSLLSECLKLLGLGSFEVEVAEMPRQFGGEGQLLLRLSRPLEVSGMVAARNSAEIGAAVARMFEPIQLEILNSPEVKAKVEKNQEELERLRFRVHELEPYAVHYELEMQLRHGRGAEDAGVRG